MNLKNLLKVLFTLAVFTLLVNSTAFAQNTIYLDATNGSNAYTGVNETNNPAGTGPKATLLGATGAQAALANLANGGTLIIKAGTYAEAFDLSGANLPALVTSYAIQLKQLNLNNDIAFTGGASNINTVGLTVTITQVVGTERITQTSTTVNMQAGSINLASATGWVLPIGTTINLTGASGFTNAAPTRTTNVSLNYTGGSSFNAGPESNYGSYGSGTITIAKTAGTTVTLPNAISAVAGIVGTSGNATFSGAVTLGAFDITTGGASTGTLTFNGAVSFSITDGTANANLGSVVNANTGSVVFNSTATWTCANQTAANVFAAGAGTYVVDNQSTGSILFNSGTTFIPDPTTGFFNTTLTAINNAGTLTLGTVTASTANAVSVILNVVNSTASGTLNIAGKIDGTLTNGNATAVTNITGATSVLGIFTNAGTTALGANTLSLTGLVANLTNGGTVTASTGKILVTSANVDIAINNVADPAGPALRIVTSVAAAHGLVVGDVIYSPGTNPLVPAGFYIVAATPAANTFTLTGLVGTGGAADATLATFNKSVSFNGGTLSNVEKAGTSRLGFITNAHNLSSLTATAGTITVYTAITVSGATTVAGGTLDNMNFTFTTTDFTENSGTFTLNANAASILDVKQNLSRTGGTFTAGAASIVRFTGTVTQTVDGGPLFQVSFIQFTNSVSPINVINTIRVSGTATISTATTVNFGTVNLVLNNAAAKIINNGIYSTTAGSGGGLIVGGGSLVTGGVSVGGQTLEGTGTFSYITVDVGAGNTATVINTLTGVKFNGILRLYTGILDVATAGVDFSPFGTSAKIVRHLWGAGAQPLLTASGGTFNVAAVTYDLEYAFGSDLAAVNADITTGSLEFSAAGLVRDLAITATTTGAGSARLPAARTFTGNLTVASGARLSLNGVALTSTKTSAVHSVVGAITQVTPAATEELILTGNGTLAGGVGTTAAQLSQIDRLDVNTAGSYTISNLKLLGSAAAGGVGNFEVRGGAQVTLTMPNTAAVAPINPGDVYNLLLTNGNVTLGYHADFPAAGAGLQSFNVTATGTFDFANFNVYWYSISANAVFTSAAGATFLATGATTGGFLQIRASASINTAGAVVPRIIVDPDDAGAYTLTLAGNLGVSGILTIVPTTAADIIAMGANTLTLSGSAVWNHGTLGQVATYTGTGVFNITGNVTANLGTDATIPNLTVNNGANTFTLVDNDAVAGTVPNLTVGTLFTMTAGTITQGNVDIILTAAGAVFAYTAGTINQNTTKGTAATDIQNGELKFNNAGAQTFTVGTTVLSLPNLTIVGAGGVSLVGTNPFTVSQRLVIGTSLLTFGATGRMTLADQAWVMVNGNVGALSHVPTFAGVIDLYYNIAAAVAAGNERPTGAGNVAVLRDLFVGVTGGFALTLGAPIQVNRSLALINGNIVTTAVNTITMAANTAVTRTVGTVNVAATANANLLGGPITLTYNNATVGMATANGEFPATAGFVSTLNVNSNPGAGAIGLVLHATRSVGDFVLNMGTTVANGATAIFNLAGFTLNVTNATSATLTRGIIADQNAVGGFYVYGTFNVTGSLTSTANSSIQNLNTTANTAALAGAFGSTDWDGAGGNALPAGVPLLTLSGTSSVAGVAGNITTTGPLTINGAVNGNITTSSNITVSATGALNAAATLTFNGATGQTLSLAVASNINTLNVNQTGLNPLLNITGANLTIGGIVNFTNGIINLGVVATDPTLILPNPTGAANGGLAFNRAGVTGTNVGHVYGKIQRPALTNDGAGGTNGRFEFPVGTLSGQYRPAQITFTPAYVVGNPVGIIVSHLDSSPQGIKDLPLDGGAGVQIGNYPNFYWLVRTTPSSLTSTQRFDIDLQANNIGYPYTSDAQLRIIRRQDGDATTNGWSLQGTAANYSNYQVVIGTDTTVVVRTTSSQGGLVWDGSRFTLGIPTRAPLFTAPTTLTYTMNEADSLFVTFTADPQDVGETVSYSLVSPPSFASINATTGVLGLRPGYADGSTTPYSITVRATDAPGGKTADRTISVTVTNINRAPVFTAQMTNKTIKNDSTLTFTYVATDADGEALTYALVPVTPAFAGTATVGASTGLLTFAPTLADAGKVFSVGVTVTDGIAPVASTVAQVTVTYARSKGDVDGNGVVQAVDASKILQHVVGLITITGADNLYAADVNSDGQIGALDAAWILYYVVNGSFPTGKIGAVNGAVSWGDVTNKSDIVTIPLKLSEGTNVLSAFVSLTIDKNLAGLESVSSSLPEGWQIVHHLTDAGMLNIALAGLKPLEDGSFVNLSLKLLNKEAKMNVEGSVALNDQLTSMLKSLSVRQVPTQFGLSQNYPNPFNPTTKIQYQLPQNANVTLAVYDLLGQKVKTLLSSEQEAGYYNVEWNGLSDNGTYVTSGLYIYRLEAGSYVATKKMNFVK